MKHYLSLLFIAFGVFILHSENYAYTGFFSPQQDSIIHVTGHVYDSATHEPISQAIVTYEELPYGNFIGIIKTENKTGKYEFNTFGDEGYRVEVKAKNYQTIVEMINPVNNAVNGTFTKDYYLVNEPEEGTVIKLENLIFDLGKSEIKPESYEELNQLVAQMKQYREMIIQLEGHTDFRGGRTQNLKLSEDRVMEVKKYLINKGIRPDRILTRAFGGSKPISRESSDEAAALNRRVEVRIIKR